MTRQVRSRLAPQWSGRACEGLEPRLFLSSGGMGARLLPAEFDPADYAEIGPSLAAVSAAPAVVAGAEEADPAARFSSAAELEDYLIEMAVRRVDRDGDVDLDDLGAMRSNFGGRIEYGHNFDEIVLPDGTIGRKLVLFDALAIDAAMSAEGE